MVRSRLEELQKKSKHINKVDVEKGVVATEMQPLKAQDRNMSDSCAEFFEKFERVIADIDKVQENHAEARRLHSKILNSAHEDKEADGRLSDLTEANKRLGAKIRDALKSEQDKLDEKALKATNLAADNKKRSAREEYENRLRRTQISSQSRRFFNLWADYNNEQVNFRDKSKALLVRRCKIVNCSLSDEQIEEMLDEGNTQVFAASILDQEKVARQQLNDLQDRHDEFLKLERSIREVHELFLEVSALVSRQGELVDNILTNVDFASTKVEEGRGQLQKAEQHQKSARKLKIILGLVLFVLLLIIVLVILSELGAFSHSNGQSSEPINKVYVVTDSGTMDASTSDLKTLLNTS